MSIQSPFFRIADSSDETRGRNQRFTRDAAEVQAIAAHLVALDQRNAAAKSRRSRRRYQPGGSRADDNDIVNAFTFFHRGHAAKLGDASAIDYSAAKRLLKGINDLSAHLMSETVWVRTFLSELHAWQWLGILVARLAVGLLFFLSDCSKLFVPERREQMRETLFAAHIPFPEFNALFVSMIEFVFGFLLILGALTPVACVMLGCVMIVAILTTAVRNIKAADFGISVSPRSALPDDPFLAFPLRPWLVQYRSSNFVPCSILTSAHNAR